MAHTIRSPSLCHLAARLVSLTYDSLDNRLVEGSRSLFPLPVCYISVSLHATIILLKIFGSFMDFFCILRAKRRPYITLVGMHGLKGHREF